MGVRRKPRLLQRSCAVTVFDVTTDGRASSMRRVHALDPRDRRNERRVTVNTTFGAVCNSRRTVPASTTGAVTFRHESRRARADSRAQPLGFFSTKVVSILLFFFPARQRLCARAPAVRYSQAPSPVASAFHMFRISQWRLTTSRNRDGDGFLPTRTRTVTTAVIGPYRGFRYNVSKRSTRLRPMSVGKRQSELNDAVRAPPRDRRRFEAIDLAHKRSPGHFVMMCIFIRTIRYAIRYRRRLRA